MSAGGKSDHHVPSVIYDVENVTLIMRTLVFCRKKITRECVMSLGYESVSDNS